MGEAYVVDFGDAGLFDDIVNHRRQVVVADLVPAVLPEGGGRGVEGHVAPGVRVASDVAHPYVVAGFGENVRCEELEIVIILL